MLTINNLVSDTNYTRKKKEKNNKKIDIWKLYDSEINGKKKGDRIIIFQ